MAKNKKHILVVDDVTTNLRYIGEVLKDKYTLSMAKSATQALKLMEKSIPDLILLDIKMPVMDGYEMLKTLKGDARYSEVPVIFLTADADEENETKGLRMGASDFIKKPFVPEVMLSRIERILSQEEKNKEIRLMALKDPLTGLWNRTYIEDKVNEYTSAGMKGSFMLLDLDNFKGINDTFGHVAGDEALVAFGKTLSSFVHKDDVVARIGGDEFAVFLKDAVGEKLLGERIGGLIKDVEEKLNVVKVDTTISSVSVGISEMPANGNSFIELYNKADTAMYYVKRNGKHGYRFYSGQERMMILDGNAEDKSVLDLSQLRRYIDEDVPEDGPYKVEYNSFKNIYRFLKRYAERTKTDVQILLFTVKNLAVASDEDNLPAAMEALSDSIKKALRKNDVSSMYSGCQYLVILMDVSDENRKIVLDRILKFWDKFNTNGDVLLKYDIEEIMETEESSSEVTVG
ncbi:MAG: diguanylate cyclase [Lachnospiraceae bacterium]|nr:diguanylate cyclase [Lachnospiraceae bacterium]